MRELSKEEMLDYFEEINNRLAAMGKHGEILLVGGAALTMVFNARTSTRDIDAIFRPQEDMRKIASRMAEDYGLEYDWLNDAVKPFVTDKMKFELFMSFSNLTISSINAEGLLAMKLTAARFGTKDMEDSIFLMKIIGIKTEGEVFEIINNHINPILQKPNVKYFAMEAFKKYSQQA